MTNTVKKIALVTGGSRGLGKDMALQLAHKGFDVILTYQTKSEFAQEVVNEIKNTGKNAYAIQLDVANADSFNQFVTNLSTTLKNEFQAEKLYALVNNAGVGIYASFAETSIEQFPANAISNNVTIMPPSERSCPARILLSSINSCVT